MMSPQQCTLSIFSEIKLIVLLLKVKMYSFILEVHDIFNNSKNPLGHYQPSGIVLCPLKSVLSTFTQSAVVINDWAIWYHICFSLRGCTPNQKLACFVLYLKIINTFLKKIMYASYSKLSKELKNGIRI